MSAKENKEARAKDEEKSDTIEIPVGKSINKMRKNPWIISTVILAIVLIVFVVLSIFGVLGTGFGGGKVSASTAGSNAVAFLNSNPQLQGGVTLVSSEPASEVNGQLYKVTVNYQGKEVPVYTTLDGKYLVANVVPLNETGGNTNPDTTPTGPVDVNISGAPVEGNKTAKVTVVEVSDYQCPFCRKFWTDSYSQLKKEYIDTGKVKWVFMDFPLDFHPMAKPSANAAECVREKGGDAAYFKMHDKMFAEENKIDSGNVSGPVKSTVTYTEADLKKWAKDIGYSVDSCIDSHKFYPQIEAEQQYTGSIGVSGTPAFFINGQLLEGAQPAAAFEQAIDAALAA